MGKLRTFWALMYRELIEHRIGFVYLPLGLVLLLIIGAVVAGTSHDMRIPNSSALPTGQKLFETGYLVLIILWWFYLGVVLFFFFGDSFSADRRNNAMFFWKSLPVSDRTILFAKLAAALTLLPLVVFLFTLLTGLINAGLVILATTLAPGVITPPQTGDLVSSYVQISWFALVYLVLALLWYLPFLTWVGALSTVFGRWSLPLAVLAPALLITAENLIFFGKEPVGGYIWGYLGTRWQFGLPGTDYGLAMISAAPFNASYYIQRLMALTNWTSLVAGLAFSLVVLLIAAEYRRRRIN